MLAIILQFFQDNRTLTLIGLIIVNLVTGVMAALVTGTFDLGRIAEFYRVKVIPYILGYLLIYVLALVGIAELLGAVVGDLVAWGGMAVAVANLLADIARNLGEMRDHNMQGKTPTKGDLLVAQIERDAASTGNSVTIVDNKDKGG